jgi:hypothetical protein
MYFVGICTVVDRCACWWLLALLVQKNQKLVDGIRTEESIFETDSSVKK